MIRNVEFNRVEDIAIAIVPDKDEETGIDLWRSYFINFKEINLENIMIRVRGIGQKEHETVNTSTLRVLLENVSSNGYAEIDMFEAGATSLSNEYWVSFRLDEYLYDKKFVFVPESIIESNFIKIPFLEKKGVMIK